MGVHNLSLVLYTNVSPRYMTSSLCHVHPHRICETQQTPARVSSERRRTEFEHACPKRAFNPKESRVALSQRRLPLNGAPTSAKAPRKFRGNGNVCMHELFWGAYAPIVGKQKDWGCMGLLEPAEGNLRKLKCLRRPCCGQRAARRTRA